VGLEGAAGEANDQERLQVIDRAIAGLEAVRERLIREVEERPEWRGSGGRSGPSRDEDYPGR
jgi:hypothetical protein